VCPITAYENATYEKHIYGKEKGGTANFFNIVMPKLNFSLEDKLKVYLFMDIPSVKKLTA
jgi:hypothetical protein